MTRSERNRQSDGGQAEGKNGSRAIDARECRKHDSLWLEQHSVEFMQITAAAEAPYGTIQPDTSLAKRLVIQVDDGHMTVDRPGPLFQELRSQVFV